LLQQVSLIGGIVDDLIGVSATFIIAELSVQTGLHRCGV
jgi:hypothetical protein